MMPSILALHEAAHAVVAHALGHRVAFITLVPGELEDGFRYAGRVNHRQRIDVFDRDKWAGVLAKIVIALAGRAIERRVRPAGERSDIDKGAEHDIAQVNGMLGALDAADRSRVLFATNRHAFAMVDELWLPIFTVARALDDAGGLSYVGLDALIHEAKTEWAVAGPMNPGMTQIDYVSRST